MTQTPGLIPSSIPQLESGLTRDNQELCHLGRKMLGRLCPQGDELSLARGGRGVPLLKRVLTSPLEKSAPLLPPDHTVVSLLFIQQDINGAPHTTWSF